MNEEINEEKFKYVRPHSMNTLETDQDYQNFMQSVIIATQMIAQQPLEKWIEKNRKAVDFGWMTAPPQDYMRGSERINDIYMPFIKKAKELVDTYLEGIEKQQELDK